MKLRNLIDKIESKYPTNLAYSWDNVGLLVGEYEKEVKQILLMMMAEATAAFEKLPCLLDAEILRNILYRGVWAKYEKIQKERQEIKEDHGK